MRGRRLSEAAVRAHRPSYMDVEIYCACTDRLWTCVCVGSSSSSSSTHARIPYLQHHQPCSQSGLPSRLLP